MTTTKRSNMGTNKSNSASKKQTRKAKVPAVSREAAEKLAQYWVDGWDMDTLVSYAIEQMADFYEWDNEKFWDEMKDQGFKTEDDITTKD